MRHSPGLSRSFLTTAGTVLATMAIAALGLAYPAQAAPAPAGCHNGGCGDATLTAAAPPGHVILKAGSGKAATTLALATTGKAGAAVYAGRYRASNHAEDWHSDHEPGAAFPGGRFGFYWAPGGVQTNLYIHAGSTTYLVNGGPAATIFTAVPEGSGYVTLEYLPGGVQTSGFVLTYAGAGHVVLKGAGSPIRPTADQLWKVTG
jgi:hypothetical protein